MNTRWKRYFGWSKSRSEVFWDCPKRYSFQYLFKWEDGRAAGLAKAASKLSPLAVHKGSLVHDELARWITAFDRHGVEDPAASMSRLGRTFEELERRAETRVLEACFGYWTAEEVGTELARAREDALFQLDRFHREIWPGYRGQAVVSCEVLERFEVDATPMWVAADLVVRDDAGDLVVVDWKTGASRQAADDSVQLTGYLLWASRRFDLPLTRLRAELVWLATGEVDATTRSPEQLEEFLATMQTETREMLAVTDYAEIAARPSEGRCRRCPFLPLCRDAATPLPPPSRQAALRRLADTLCPGG